MARLILGAAALAVAGLIPVVQAATIDVPEDYPTIQAGVNAATAGDTVLVRCGTYYEHDIVLHPGIVLRGEGNADCVMIDARHMGRVLTCPPGIAQDTRIEALTIREGSPSGLRCESASLIVANCVFAANGMSQTISGFGAGLIESRATFINCTFEDNQVAIGGFTCPSIDINGCQFFGNRTRMFGTLYFGSTPATLANCIFVHNVAPVTISAESCLALDVESCTFVDAFEVLGLQNTSATLSHSIITLSDGHEPVICDATSTATLQCCDVYADWVGCIAGQHGLNGNMARDPFFCAPQLRDYRINSSSPCAPENSPKGCGLIGALPVGCGPQAVVPATWGRVKAMWH